MPSEQQPISAPRSLGSRLAVCFALLLLAIGIVTVIWLGAIGELYRSGPRTDYFLYMGALVLAALAASRWPRAAWTLLVLALVEFSWGVGSFVIHNDGNRVGLLLPTKTPEPARFQWHPLLQAELIPSLAITSPYGLKINHTSAGTRGREPAQRDMEGRVVVAVYGGSSTYDVGVGDGDTWADRLADALGRERYFIVNNGVPGYTTVEHVVQTAFYQDKFGRTPRCAIYYVGWNDLRNAHIPKLDPGYADFHLISQIDAQQVRRFGGLNVSTSPIFTLVSGLIGSTFDTIQYRKEDYYALPLADGDDPALDAYFERNVRTISAINRARGIATIWVGQLVNRGAFTSDGRYGWLPRVRDRDVPVRLDHLNRILANTAGALGDSSVVVPPASFGAGDFVDNGHFTIEGAKRFAQAIVPTVSGACR